MPKTTTTSRDFHEKERERERERIFALATHETANRPSSRFSSPPVASRAAASACSASWRVAVPEAGREIFIISPPSYRDDGYCYTSYYGVPSRHEASAAFFMAKFRSGFSLGGFEDRKSLAISQSRRMIASIFHSFLSFPVYLGPRGYTNGGTQNVHSLGR